MTDELAAVSEALPSESYARTGYHPECEVAVNQQINVEYTISYIYHAMYAFFDRDTVGLPGFAKYFKDASEEERGHAQLLMDFQVLATAIVALRHQHNNKSVTYTAMAPRLLSPEQDACPAAAATFNKPTNLQNSCGAKQPACELVSAAYNCVLDLLSLEIPDLEADESCP